MMSGVPGPATSVAPAQLMRLVFVVLTQLVNDARLSGLSTVTEPPIWLFSSRDGGGGGNAKLTSLIAKSIDAVEPEVFLMSRLAEINSSRLVVPGELDETDRTLTLNAPSVALPRNCVLPDGPSSRGLNVVPPSRIYSIIMSARACGALMASAVTTAGNRLVRS